MYNRTEKLKEYLQQSPKDSFLKHALALEYIKLQQDEEAEKLFLEILADDAHYVGSYYHFGKLLERKNKNNEAIAIYAKGMEIAKQLQEMNAYRELQAAYEELVY